MAPTVEKIYKNFEILDGAGDNASKHTAEFLEILSAVKCGLKEKQLACQFISRFFRHFPGLAEQAIDAQLDLCEDEDPTIRRHAIKELPNFCKAQAINKSSSKEACGEMVTRIADILAQLLPTDDHVEASVVQSALGQLLKLDPQACLNGLFQQVLGDDEVVRERTIRLLGNKLPSMAELLATPEIEEMLTTKINLVLDGCNCEEFLILIKILSSFKTMQKLQGRQHLVDLIAEKAGVDASGDEFNALDPDSLQKLTLCTRQATEFFSKNVRSTKFLDFFCQQVLPHFALFPELTDERGDKDGLISQLDALKLVTELTSHSTIPDVKTVGATFLALCDLLPLPSSQEISASCHPDLKVCRVECLLYTFHMLARHHPDFLTTDETRLREFRKRLQFYALGLQAFVKVTKESLAGKSRVELKTEENRNKLSDLSICTNLNTLIKDLFHNPPSYKSSICLSFKTAPISAASSEEYSTSKTGSVQSNGSQAVPVRMKIKGPISEDTKPRRESDRSGAKRPREAPRRIYRSSSGASRGQGTSRPGASRFSRNIYRGR